MAATDVGFFLLRGGVQTGEESRIFLMIFYDSLRFS